MFDDDDMTNEEILAAFERGDPEGLQRFGPDWRKEMDMHPLFMDKVPQECIDGTLDRKKWPVLAAVMDLQYEDMDDPEEAALQYKEDGNEEYRKGTREGHMKAILSYTEGLSKKCGNAELNAQLYCNRAAAQFSIGNYRRATADCEESLKRMPTYLKAITRGAQSQLKLGHQKDVVEWCDKALAINKQDKSMIELKIKALQKLKEEERDARKRAACQSKERREIAELLGAIRQRNLNLYIPPGEEDDEETEDARNLRIRESLECRSYGSVSYSAEEDVLSWPVRVLYPEYATSDVIQQFEENHTLRDHLSYMFPPAGESPEWDVNREYSLPDLCVIYDSGTEKVELDQDSTLLELLQQHNILIAGGVPTFEIYIRNSETYNKNVLDRS